MDAAGWMRLICLGSGRKQLIEDQMVHKIVAIYFKIIFIDDEKQFLWTVTNLQEVESNYFSKQKNNLH